MQNLKNTFAGFWKYRYLLQNLITRDFKLKYRRSVLGVAWSVLNPLLTCLVMWAVFGALFNVRGQGIEDFPLFLIIGQLMFNFFRESTPDPNGQSHPMRKVLQGLLTGWFSLSREVVVKVKLKLCIMK